MKSIRRHLNVSLLVGLTLLFLVTAASLYMYARTALIAQFDDALCARLDAFAGMNEVEQRMGIVVVELEFTEFPFPEYEPSSDAEYYQVRREDGTSFARSPSLEGDDLPRLEVEADKTVIRDMRLPDGRQGRFAARWFTPTEETDELSEPGIDEPDELLEQAPVEATGIVETDKPTLLLTLARSREALDATLATLLTGFLGTAALLMAGIVLIVRRSITRGLAPLDRIAIETAGIESNNLAFRFPTQELPRELTPISRRLNELLERLETAFARERRFNADIAHELRTPIAERRALAEVAMKSVKENDDSKGGRYFSDVLAIARQMEKLVSTLLALVRCEGNQQAVHKTGFDLIEAIEKVTRIYREEALQRKIGFEQHLAGTAIIHSDRDLVSAILVNLFCNAVTHTPEGGTISCVVEKSGSGFTIRLANDTDPLEPEDLDRIFEPLWKKDPARTDTTGSGLGLALVAAYAKLLDLEIDVSLPTHDRFEITIRL